MQNLWKVNLCRRLVISRWPLLARTFLATKRFNVVSKLQERVWVSWPFTLPPLVTTGLSPMTTCSMSFSSTTRWALVKWCRPQKTRALLHMKTTNSKVSHSKRLQEKCWSLSRSVTTTIRKRQMNSIRSPLHELMKLTFLCRILKIPIHNWLISIERTEKPEYGSSITSQMFEST